MSLIHIAQEKVYTKVIHADMLFPQIETRVRIQVALELFTLRNGSHIGVQNNEMAAISVSQNHSCEM